jgi:hypothetical protein
MSLTKTARVGTASKWVLLASLVAGLPAVAMGQSEPAAPPPPPPGMMMTMQAGDMGGAFFHHEEIGEGRKVVTGAPMTAVITITRDTTLSDGNTIHTENQSTVYRDSQGRVRREVPFELVTPTTGATKGSMIVIVDPVSGTRYMLNPQNKTAHQMPVHASKGPHGASEGELPTRAPNANTTTESLGTKTFIGLPAQGTRMTHTIPAGQIGNAKPISVVTERWVSTDLQIPLSMTHTDPMMGTMTTSVVSVNRGEPDASLFQVPADYKVETGKPDFLYMPAKP